MSGKHKPKNPQSYRDGSGIIIIVASCNCCGGPFKQMALRGRPESFCSEHCRWHKFRESRNNSMRKLRVRLNAERIGASR